ncbi:MAG: histidine phosphatase family protein [Bacteroidales bacterium]
MPTRIIIARHGNTFLPNETPTRVGAKTDLPLVEETRARSIGLYLKSKGIIPDRVYASPLLRAKETAKLAIEELGLETKLIELDDFTEIDYGVDENQTEDVVRLRLGNGDPEKGKEIIKLWDKEAIVPNGWKVNPQQIIDTWLKFADNNIADNETVLVVSSNGVIRFAPYLTGDFEKFTNEFGIKVATGGVSIFEKNKTNNSWICTEWNTKAFKLYDELK